MGHVINPISQRIGYTRFWSTNWALSLTSKNSNYSFIMNESVQLLRYLRKVLFAFIQRLFPKGWLLLNLQLLRFNNLLTFIFINQMKFIKNLYKFIYKGLNTMFIRKKTEFTWRWSVSKNFSERKRRLRHLFHMCDQYPYKSYKKNVTDSIIMSSTTLIKKLNNHFLYITKRIPRFNIESNEPSLLTYSWMNFLAFFSLSQNRKRKIFKRDMVSNLLKVIFVSRWISKVKAFLQFSLKRIIYGVPLEIIFVCVNSTSLSANFVSKYLSTRLLQKFPIRRLMSNLIKQLKLSQQNAYIHGFKIVCNGRFARRGRASHVWKMLGKLPISNKNIFVDYSIMLPVLLNSICAVKVWLLKSTDSTRLFVI